MGIIALTLRKRYQWCHLAQLVRACVLVQPSLTHKAINKRKQSLTPTEFVSFPTTAASTKPSRCRAIDGL